MPKLNVGDAAPGFTLTSSDGERVSLSDYSGQRVILFFYPRAATPGCTRQACGFRDNLPTIEEAGAAVIGVSPDSPADLAKWKEEENFAYPLLSDEDHEVAEAYGVWGEKTSFGRTYMGIIRSHFVIDEEGKLQDVQYNVSPEKSVERALEAL
ncbi:MAG TPA: thioredoxin-dependent thiol peroxidase [Candidatus Sulfomarinibacteraceae bacterium]|nr:thioredoxin-dependent thiol peroxidase [Candidatus Sulfomarinibacteraceae bacterium]